MKRTPLKRRTPLRSAAAMKRVAMRRHPTSGGFPQDVRNAAYRRSGGKCEVMAPGCRGRFEHLHHRQRRAHGGPNTLANAVACCQVCHHHIHANPRDAIERGLLLRSFEDPEAFSAVRWGDRTAG